MIRAATRSPRPRELFNGAVLLRRSPLVAPPYPQALEMVEERYRSVETRFESACSHRHAETIGRRAGLHRSYIGLRTKLAAHASINLHEALWYAAHAMLGCRDMASATLPNGSSGPA